MIETAIHLVIGAGGTALYLYVWTRVTRTPSAGPVPQRGRRRRGWQVLFFTAMTPYVLLLFFLMEQAQGLFATGPPGIANFPQ